MECEIMANVSSDIKPFNLTLVIWWDECLYCYKITKIITSLKEEELFWFYLCAAHCERARINLLLWIIQMDHPNIIKLECVYVEKRRIFVVMELMNGGELLDRILDKERFTEEEARSVIRPIVDAVRYCHSIGIVHRDLKVRETIFTLNFFQNISQHTHIPKY